METQVKPSETNDFRDVQMYFRERFKETDIFMDSNKLWMDYKFEHPTASEKSFWVLFLQTFGVMPMNDKVTGKSYFKMRYVPRTDK